MFYLNVFYTSPPQQHHHCRHHLIVQILKSSDPKVTLRPTRGAGAPQATEANRKICRKVEEDSQCWIKIFHSREKL